MVLLVLAGIWAAVLVPPMLRSRSEARPADSIGNFRRQLHVLQRTGPVASRIGGVTASAPSAPVPPMGPGSAGRQHPAALRGPRGAHRASPDSLRRSRTQKRRRDVLAVLLAGMTGTLMLGLLPSLRVLLALHLVLDVVCVAYLAMLVRARNVAAERDMKLRFLPSAPPDNIIMLRRSAN